jgi:hypothetical protein
MLAILRQTITAKPISKGIMLMIREWDSNFCLLPELAPSSSLAARRPVSNSVTKTPIPAPTLKAVIVVIVLTVIVDTIVLF